MRTSHQIIVSLVIFVTAAANEGSALHCWTCATSAIDGQFCRDPFKISGISEEMNQIAYKECPQASHGLKPVCKKLKQRIDNVIEIKRGCFYRDSKEVVPISCTNDPKPPDVITLSCEICETDGCNGTMGLALIHNSAIIVPTIITLIFKLLIL